MKNMIYTMGFVDDNGDIIIGGNFCDGGFDNLICISISKEKIKAELFKTETILPELSPELIRQLCRDNT